MAFFNGLLGVRHGRVVEREGQIKFLTVRNLITRWARRSYVAVSVNSLQCGPTAGHHAERRVFVPEGQRENGPAFQRRECGGGHRGGSEPPDGRLQIARSPKRHPAEGGQIADSVGETPTGATGTVAVPGGLGVRGDWGYFPNAQNHGSQLLRFLR